MIQHISVRVPWHDNGWNGYVCKNPKYNQSCRVLKNIAQKKDDLVEQAYVERKDDPNSEFIPPCMTESGMFMSDHEIYITRSHPYIYDRHFEHIKNTSIHIGAYSFVGTPYKWTLKDEASDSPNVRYFTNYDKTKEINVGSGRWVSNGINQKRIFNYFYGDIILDKSLVVAYAKTVPFIENPGRIIIGIGFVNSLGDLQEYDYFEPPDGVERMKSFIWERQISHTIRTDRTNGFLFPFEEIQAYLKKHPEQKPEDLVVIAPDEYRNEFSYATEHLSHDALIQTLNLTIQVLKKYQDIGISYGTGASWGDCIYWCQGRLQEIWEDRGYFPGLGAVLSALGIPYGFDVAKVLKTKYKDAELWENLIGGLENIVELLPMNMKSLAIKITKTQREDLESDIEERGDYLKLISRISLTADQAALLLDDTLRTDKKFKYANQLTDIHIKDCSTDIVGNPYLLYEKTYMLEPQYQIGIGKIDIAMFSTKEKLLENDDQRRVRAIILSILESEAKKGSSLMFINDAVNAVNKFRSDLPEIEPSIRLRTIKQRKSYFAEVFDQIEVATITEEHSENTDIALKLKRLEKIDTVIRQFVDERLAQSNNIDDDWNVRLNCVLNEEEQSDDELENAARNEKIDAIKKMARSKVSVLTGGAGTGKTTTLVALCMNEIIQRGRILVLAPTGKARVVLSTKLKERGIEHKAQTLFQYLRETDHCDSHTWSYYLSKKKDNNTPDTIIIDESSMITEEMFGALAEAISDSKRVIFVGDPNQLPPIGTGKPFYELVQKFREEEGQHHYANLLVTNRQKKNDSSNQRLDVELSKLFTEDQAAQVSDEIFEQITNDSENVEFVKCEDISILPQTIFNILEKEKNIYDIESFDFSFGGFGNDEGWISFKDANNIESWQILTPYRNNEITGSRILNRQIQLKYRSKDYHKGKYERRSTRHPLGTDAIVYGEKVINVRNQEKNGNYVANGEIGIVRNITENNHEVIFSSQNDRSYFYHSSISENDADLELAYSLTTHKAQGSGFKTTIFVLFEPERGIDPFVVRELLYTALTRQSDKVCIIYNKQPSELKKYTNSEYSDLAHRKTNLFVQQPVFKELKSGWYDSKLIHITLAGERVRSKSEVIVANALYAKNIKYKYEKALKFPNDKKISPDFTITKPNGKIIYWEHLGMLTDYGYRKDWERKKQIYAENGITIENGLLKISQDEPSGAINSQQIQAIIDTITE